MSFRRLTGKRNVTTLPAAATLVANGLAQYDEAGEIIVAVTAKGVLGISQKAATSSTNAEVDILLPGDVVECDSITGTMGASEIGNEVDISSETAVTLTESNGDAIIVGWDGTTTTKLYLTFKKLAHGASGAGAETT
jgi:hypothetical protein